MKDHKEHSSPSAVQQLSLAHLEGFGLCLLCHTDIGVRHTAMEVLGTLRTLHHALRASGIALPLAIPDPFTSICRQL